MLPTDEQFVLQLVRNWLYTTVSFTLNNKITELNLLIQTLIIITIK